MASNADDQFAGLWAETKIFLRCARGVWKLVPWRHSGMFFLAAVLVALVSAGGVAFPLLLGELTNRITNDIATSEPFGFTAVLRLLGLIAGIYVAREFIQIIRRALVESACTDLERSTMVRVIDRLLTSDLAHLSQEKIGTLQGRIGRSVVSMVRFVRLILLDLLQPILTGVFAITAVMSKAPILAVVMMGVAPLSLWLTVRQIASQKGIRLQLIRGRERIDGALVELLGGIDYVRAAHTEKFELARFFSATHELRRTETRHHFEMSLYGSARALNEGFFHILVLGMGTYMALNGWISVGDIVTFSMLFLGVMAPLNEVHRALDEGHECSLQVANLQEMLNRPVCVSYMPIKPETPRLNADTPLVIANQLVVEYATSAGPKRALDGVNLYIKHGETVGLAGPSGGGKSTLLKVLLRLAHPTAGSVTLGGVPLNAVSREQIGALVGYVGQNPFVFSGTIAENIAYGQPDTSPEAIESAACKAFIHEEILAMPGGYQARVSERGMNLSGGQRQRLALARIFLKNPPILILDEGTSALDTIGEREVKRAIDRVRKDRTVLLVAHRLSTLRNADRILVFRAGKVVEEGTYAKLCVGGGTFAELVQSAEMETAH